MNRFFYLVLVIVLASCTSRPAPPTRTPGPAPTLRPISGDAVPSAPIANGISHVVVISLDGGRPDAIQMGNAPVMQNLAATGAVDWEAQTISPSVTVPAHTSLLTGLSVEQHGVRHNEYRAEKLELPTFLSIAAAQGIPTAMISASSWLDQLHFTDEVFYHKSRTGDDEVLEFTLTRIEAGDRLIFVHFHHLDSLGHGNGWMSAHYLDGIIDIDRQIGHIVGALEAVGVDDSSLIIITADHGGHNRFHGTNLAADMTIPLIVNGPHIAPETILENTEITQVAATVLTALGLDYPDEMSPPVIDFSAD